MSLDVFSNKRITITIHQDSDSSYSVHLFSNLTDAEEHYRGLSSAQAWDKYQRNCDWYR